MAFLAVSVLYEKKRKIFSVGYLFLLLNVFIDGALCPGYFTDSRLREMEREGVQELSLIHIYQSFLNRKGLESIRHTL